MRVAIENEYDEVLDILKNAINTNYGENGAEEINEALDVVDFKEGGYETEFEKHMRLKNRAEEDKLRKIKAEIEDERRRKRCTMSLQELVETEVHKAADEFRN